MPATTGKPRFFVSSKHRFDVQMKDRRHKLLTHYEFIK